MINIQYKVSKSNIELYKNMFDCFFLVNKGEKFQWFCLHSL